MSSIERAKAFVKQASKQIGLKIVPLAVVVVSAHATSALPGFVAGSASCTGGTVSNSQITNSGSVGIKLYTSSDCSGVFSSGGGLTLSASGNGVGGVFPSTTVPVLVTFTPTFSLGGNINYAFTLNLNGSSNGPQLIGSTPSGTAVSQTFNYNIGSGFSLSTWNLSLAIVASDPSTGTLTLHVPQNSIDLNAPASTTPEPATWAMLAAGGGFLFLRRRKRNG